MTGDGAPKNTGRVDIEKRRMLYTMPDESKAWRFPDDCYRIRIGRPGIRIDSVVIEETETFVAQISDTEANTANNFEDFFETAYKTNYFVNLESFSKTLGINPEVSLILSKYKDVFEKAKQIYLRIKKGGIVLPEEIDPILDEYKKFFKEIEEFFKSFRDAHPDAIPE